MPKHPNDYPRFYMRINADMLSWLKNYAQREGISMASVIKAQLENLRRKDAKAQAHNPDGAEPRGAHERS